MYRDIHVCKEIYAKTYTYMKRDLYIETCTEIYIHEKRPTYRDMHRDTHI